MASTLEDRRSLDLAWLAFVNAMGSRLGLPFLSWFLRALHGIRLQSNWEIQKYRFDFEKRRFVVPSVQYKLATLSAIIRVLKLALTTETTRASGTLWVLVPTKQST